MGHEVVPAHPELHQGSLYSFELDGTIRKHKEKVSISNGLAWSADNKTMYYIDSVPRKIMAYDFDLATGTMSKLHMSRDMRFPTMWYVRPAKPQISLRIGAV